MTASSIGFLRKRETLSSFVSSRCRRRGRHRWRLVAGLEPLLKPLRLVWQALAPAPRTCRTCRRRERLRGQTWAPRLLQTTGTPQELQLRTHVAVTLSMSLQMRLSTLSRVTSCKLHKFEFRLQYRLLFYCVANSVCFLKESATIQASRSLHRAQEQVYKVVHRACVVEPHRVSAKQLK